MRSMTVFLFVIFQIYNSCAFYSQQPGDINEQICEYDWCNIKCQTNFDSSGGKCTNVGLTSVCVCESKTSQIDTCSTTCKSNGYRDGYYYSIYNNLVCGCSSDNCNAKECYQVCSNGDSRLSLGTCSKTENACKCMGSEFTS